MRAALGILLLALAGAAAAQEAPTPVGLWKTYSDRTGQADGLVRITQANGELEGRVERVFSPPAPSANPLCEDCSGALRNQPILGMRILYGMRADGEEWTGGEILDPDDGRVYRCTLRLAQGGRKLEVRGYIGVPLFGRTQVWERAD
ncbi:MAG TPA: DUF2147 domain-containing protein [Burkholderiales bacterium]|nr:DUF2147 domain-containing protein [Burkholderiales bacterium]